jgi:hypothetical protein
MFCFSLAQSKTQTLLDHFEQMTLDLGQGIRVSQPAHPQVASQSMKILSQAAFFHPIRQWLH